MGIGFDIFLVCLGLCMVIVIWGIVTGRVEFHNPFMPELPLTPSDKPSEPTWKTKSSKYYTYSDKDGIDREMTEEERKAFDKAMEQVDSISEQMTDIFKRNW